MKNQRGQAVIESILILMLFVLVLTLVTQKFKGDELVAQMVSAPWDRLAGMLESGNWAPRQQARTRHPNHVSRHISIKGEPTQ